MNTVIGFQDSNSNRWSHFPLDPVWYEHTSCVLDLSYFKRWFYWTGERAFKSMEQKRRFDPTAMEFKVCINNADGLFSPAGIILPVGKNFSREQSGIESRPPKHLLYHTRLEWHWIDENALSIDAAWNKRMSIDDACAYARSFRIIITLESNLEKWISQTSRIRYMYIYIDFLFHFLYKKIVYILTLDPQIWYKVVPLLKQKEMSRKKEKGERMLLDW